MTRPGALAARIDADWIEHWDTFMPDVATRDAWRAVFRDTGALTAREYHPHFTDPHTAHAWSRCITGPELAATLHAHGIQPIPDHVREPYLDALGESTQPVSGYGREATLRTALIMLHPDLTRADRDLLANARVTYAEARTLITTGTLDPERLALIAGLH